MWPPALFIPRVGDHKFLEPSSLIMSELVPPVGMYICTLTYLQQLFKGASKSEKCKGDNSLVALVPRMEYMLYDTYG